MIKPIVDMIVRTTGRTGRTRRYGTGFDRVASKRILTRSPTPTPFPEAYPACSLSEVTDDALLLVAPLAGDGARIYRQIDNEPLTVTWEPKELSWMICQILYASTHFNIRLHAKNQPKNVTVSAGRMIADPTVVYLDVAHDGPTLRPSVLRLASLCEGCERVDYDTPGIELLAVKTALIKGGGTMQVQSPCRETQSGVRYRLIFGRGSQASGRSTA